MADPFNPTRATFEPPEWWKKWRPLRWILAVLVLYWGYTLVPEETGAPAPPVTQAVQKTPPPAVPSTTQKATTPQAAVQPPAPQQKTQPAKPPETAAAVAQTAAAAAAKPPVVPAQPSPLQAAQSQAMAPQPVTPPHAAAPATQPAPAVVKPPLAAAPPAKPVELRPVAPVVPAPVTAKPPVAPAKPLPPAPVPSSPRPQVAQTTPAPLLQKSVSPPATTGATTAQKKSAPAEAMVDTLPSAQKAPAPMAAADVGDPATPYTSVAKDPVALMDKLRSYSSVQAVTEQLQRGGYTWKADNLVKPGRRNYPPYRTDTLTIAGYRHLGQEGQLTLEFFNDRLYETNFAPANAESYLRILRKQGVPLRREESGRSQMTQGALHVETNIDFAVSDVGRQLHITPYIYWRDLRLMQQLKDWGPLN